jgi:hypothetical protein
MKTLITLTLLLALSAPAADMTRGYSFSAGEQVTHTKLNNLVDGATINGAFFSGKSAVTNAADGDLLLLYSAANSGLRRITVEDLLFRSGSLITGRTADTTPAVGDYLLTYDVSAGGLRKTTLNEAVYQSDNLINGRTNWLTPALDTYFLAYDDGAWSKVARSNLWSGVEERFYATNWATAATVTNSDYLWLTSYDGTNALNRKVNVAGMITNLSEVTTNAQWIQTFTTSNTVAKVSINSISNVIVAPAIAGAAPTVYATGESNVASGLAINAAHGLGGRPAMLRCLLICKTADLGYSVNDEVDASSFTEINSSDEGLISYGSNTTNVFAVISDEGTLFQTLNKSTGAFAAINPASWKIKIYAWRWQ